MEQEESSPILSALGSAVVGAIYGSFLLSIVSSVVRYAEPAILLTAAGVAFSVAVLSRYRHSLIGSRKTPVWLPAALGGIAGGVTGLVILWLAAHGSSFNNFLPVGALAGGVSSYLFETLPDEGDEERSESTRQ